MIEFKITLNTNPKASLEGYVNKNEIDTEEPIHWYDRTGYSYNSNFPQNPISTTSFTSIYDDYETLINSFYNDDMFLQYLWDYQDQQAEINRGDYTIHIGCEQ